MSGGTGTSRAPSGVPKLGQVILAGALVAIVVGLIFSTFETARQQESQRETVLSEESDGTAMTLVQRESFGVVMAIDSWARGYDSARDAQIARALLSQRLQVVTASGLMTFELAPDDYRSSLAELDVFLRQLSTVDDDQRVSVRQQADSQIAEFTSQSKNLSNVFQAIIREQAEAAFAERVSALLWQGVLAVLALMLGVLLGWWIVAEIARNYRETSQLLAAEALRLDTARQRLTFRVDLDRAASNWSEAVASESATPEILSVIRRDLELLLPGPLLFVDTVGDEHTVRVVDAEGETGSVERDNIAAAAARVEDTVQLLKSRDSIGRSFEDQLKRDPLTQLPNHGQIESIMGRILAEASEDAMTAVVIVDIDQFADYNNSFGREQGDRLLVEIAQRITLMCNHHRVAVRLTADEFACIGTFDSVTAVEVFAQVLSEVLSFDIAVEGETVTVMSTIGYSHSGLTNNDGAPLIQEAFAALAYAQTAGLRPRIAAFDPKRDDVRKSALREDSVVRAAFKEGEYSIHFQPVVDIATGEFAGVEALARWDRPHHGVVMPEYFLPVLERVGLTVDFGRFIVEQTLLMWGTELRLAANGGYSLDDVFVTMNIDAEHLLSVDFVNHLVDVAHRNGVPLESIVIEITEHVALDDAVAVSQLRAVRLHGIKVALDDFGTGYSSLANASSLPLDILKIDKSFLAHVEWSAQSVALIRDIVSIAQTLALRVIAEGVESASAAGILRELDVELAQGWLYSRALPVEELRQWFISRHSLSSER